MTSSDTLAAWFIEFFPLPSAPPSDAGVLATAISADGPSALTKACLAGHREVAALLVQHGADIDKALGSFLFVSRSGELQGRGQVSFPSP